MFDRRQRENLSGSVKLQGQNQARGWISIILSRFIVHMWFKLDYKTIWQFLISSLTTNNWVSLLQRLWVELLYEDGSVLLLCRISRYSVVLFVGIVYQSPTNTGLLRPISKSGLPTWQLLHWSTMTTDIIRAWGWVLIYYPTLSPLLKSVPLSKSSWNNWSFVHVYCIFLK